MAITVNLTDVTSTEDAIDGRSYVETYVVTGVQSVNEAYDAPGVPRLQDVYSDDPTNIVVSRDGEYIEESVTAYEIRVQYRAMFGGGDPETEGEEETAGDATVNGGNAIVQVWRTQSRGLALAFPNNKDEPGGTDIGGHYADNAGEPIDFVLPVLQLRLPVRFRGFAPTATLTNFLYTRNDRRFDIFAPGTVLFTAYNLAIDPITGGAAGDYSFVADPWFHLRQQTNYDSEAKVITLGADKVEAEDHPERIGRALRVRWYQPFPTTLDLTYLLRLRSG